MTAIEVTVGGVRAEAAVAEAKPAKKRTRRKTFKEIRAAEREAVIAGQRAYYEPTIKEMSEEIGRMQKELKAHRETLDKISGSWITALRYWAKGHV